MDTYDVRSAYFHTVNCHVYIFIFVKSSLYCFRVELRLNYWLLFFFTYWALNQRIQYLHNIWPIYFLRQAKIPFGFVSSYHFIQSLLMLCYLYQLQVKLFIKNLFQVVLDIFFQLKDVWSHFWSFIFLL